MSYRSFAALLATTSLLALPAAAFAEETATTTTAADAAADASQQADTVSEPEVGSGPSDITAAAGLGDDVPAAPASGDLPGEPPVDPLPAVDVEAAGVMLVPIGEGHKQGKRLKDMPVNWIEFAVRPSSARYFEPYPEFAQALEVWAREKFPALWEARS